MRGETSGINLPERRDTTRGMLLLLLLYSGRIFGKTRSPDAMRAILRGYIYLKEF